MADEWREDIGMVAAQISYQVVLAIKIRLDSTFNNLQHSIMPGVVASES